MHRRIWRICGLAIVTVLFISGNRVAADELFKNMENRLLSDMGSLKIETTTELADVQDHNWSESTDLSDTAVGNEQRSSPELTEEEMAEILNCWRYNGGEVIHEPMKGQISMETAIENAKKWVWEMLQNGGLPEILFNLVSDDGEELMLDSAVAVLLTCDTGYETAKMANLYYSRWNVTFTCDYGMIEFTLNAVTGKVWCVDMTIIGETEKIYSLPDETDVENFARLAGMKTEGACCFVPSETGGIWSGETGRVYAKGDYMFWEDGSLDDYGAFEYGKIAEVYGREISSCQLGYRLDVLEESIVENQMAID